MICNSRHLTDQKGTTDTRSMLSGFSRNPCRRDVTRSRIDFVRDPVLTIRSRREIPRICSFVELRKAPPGASCLFSMKFSRAFPFRESFLHFVTRKPARDQQLPKVFQKFMIEYSSTHARNFLIYENTSRLPLFAQLRISLPSRRQLKLRYFVLKNSHHPIRE